MSDPKSTDDRKMESRGEPPSTEVMVHSEHVLHIRSVSGDDYNIYRFKINGGLFIVRNGVLMKLE